MTKVGAALRRYGRGAVGVDRVEHDVGGRAGRVELACTRAAFIAAVMPPTNRSSTGLVAEVVDGRRSGSRSAGAREDRVGGEVGHGWGRWVLEVAKTPSEPRGASLRTSRHATSCRATSDGEPAGRGSSGGGIGLRVVGEGDADGTGNGGLDHHGRLDERGRLLGRFEAPVPSGSFAGDGCAESTAHDSLGDVSLSRASADLGEPHQDRRVHARRRRDRLGPPACSACAASTTTGRSGRLRGDVEVTLECAGLSDTFTRDDERLLPR